MENAIMSDPTHNRPLSTASSRTSNETAPRTLGWSSPWLVWTGRGLSSLFVLFMLGASVAPKVLQLPVAEASMAQLGWPAGYAFSIGLLELTCVVLYVIPRTSIFGAVLTMGLLGGAMATQIRAESPVFSHVLFSLYVGIVMWGGLWLRNPRLRALFPLVRE